MSISKIKNDKKYKYNIRIKENYALSIRSNLIYWIIMKIIEIGQCILFFRLFLHFTGFVALIFIFYFLRLFVDK